MQICGIQKLTLLDYPGKVACTVFMGGCNFRCPFCHNAELVVGGKTRQEIPEEEVLSFLEKRRGVLDGVCVSGGEPLLQPDLAAFLGRIKQMGYLVKLDTNGSMPERLCELAGQGLLDYVAMDLKNSPEGYGATVGIRDFDVGDVDRSIRFLLGGAVPYEFRTTVVREFHLQQFVDSGHLIGSGLHAYDRGILEQALEIVKKYVKTAQIRGV